jgi:hypothetical protein
MRPDVTEIRRIYQNISTLLAEGQFPGKCAPAIAESLDFISKLLNEMQEPANNGEGQPKAKAHTNDRAPKRTRRVERS